MKAILELRCSAHPTYRAVYPPRSGIIQGVKRRPCKTCLQLYNLLNLPVHHDTRRTGHSQLHYDKRLRALGAIWLDA